MLRRARWRDRSSLFVALTAVALLSACRTAVLTDVVEARRLASDLHIQFTKTADAANRAVMADTDDASVAAAREAEQAADAAQGGLQQLEPLLRSLGYTDETRQLDTFKTQFAEYRKIDAEILPLAVENTNLKAQRLSFGAANDAAVAFQQAIAAAARTAKGACCVDAIAANARASVLAIQVIHARHIAESQDAAMASMEQEMAAQEKDARNALAQLKAQLPAAAASSLTAATAALDRFTASTAEIVSLSRRNSNVRSLALSMGRKRMLTAECEDQLRALEDALAKHDFTATR